MTYEEFITKVERKPPKVNYESTSGLIFNAVSIQRFLDNPTEVSRLSDVFTWADTPQGHNYWSDRAFNSEPLVEDDFEYLRGLINGL